MTSTTPSPARRLARFLPALLLVGDAAAAWRAGLLQALSLHGFASRQAALQAAAAVHPILSVGGYVLVFTLLTAACVPAALVLTLASGALLGTLVGGAATVTGALAGALLTYAAARTALAPWLRARAERDPRLRRVMQGFGANAFGYILTLRFIPVAPFALVNIAAGLAGAPLRAFVLATLAGAMVTSFLYASLGAGLGRSLGDARSVSAALKSPALLWPLLGLALLAFLPTALRLWRARVRRPADR